MKNVKIEFGITNNSRNEHQHKGKISSNNSSYSPLLSKPIFPNINQSKGDGTGRKKKLFNGLLHLYYRLWLVLLYSKCGTSNAITKWNQVLV